MMFYLDGNMSRVHLADTYLSLTQVKQYSIKSPKWSTPHIANFLEPRFHELASLFICKRTGESQKSCCVCSIPNNRAQRLHLGCLCSVDVEIACLPGLSARPTDQYVSTVHVTASTREYGILNMVAGVQ